MNEQNTKLAYYRILSAFFIILMVVIVYSVFWGPAARFADSLTPARVFSVNAEGKVIAEPDIAKVSFSIVSRGYDPEAIAQMNNKKMNEAIDYIKLQGIDSKDIKTTQYNLNPVYVYDEKNGRNYISGYELTQTILVKVRDLGKVGKILGALPEFGINQIGQIVFDVDEPEKYLVEARNKAFDLAHEKAKSMADKNGVKLGRIVSFGEYQQGPIPYYETLGKGGATSMNAAVAPSIEPGSQEITIQAFVTYEIK